MRIGIFSVAVLLFLGGLPILSTQADTCGPLKILASVNLAVAPEERAVLVPVMLQGQKKFLLLDTGGALNELTPATVSSLGLQSFRTPALRFYDLSGNYVDHATVVPDFSIGALTGHDVEFVVGPEYLFSRSKNIAGILGPGILRFYDAAIDFGAKTLTLISQDHCAGKVVYWPAQAVAVVPMQVAKASGHILVPVELDGRKLDALIDTGATHSVLNLSIAEDDFKLSEKQSDMAAIGRRGGRDSSVYRHTFNSLSFGGISVFNPALDIIPDLERGRTERPPPIGTRFKDTDVEDRPPDLLIGMDVLRHLHLYIAYGEQKLYITPASEPTSKGPTTGAPSQRPAPR